MSDDPSMSPQRDEAQSSGSTITLRCQWCAKALQAGETICPSCGSIGVPDPRLQPQATGALTAEQPGEQVVLTEWWRDDAPGGYDGSVVKNRMSFADAERRKVQTYYVIGISVAVCMLAGWLAGPLLSGLVENLTGTTVENGSDLRPMGAIIGLMTGFFIGATGGWFVWSNKG